MLLKYFKLVSFSLLISLVSKAAENNYPSFITASKVSVIDNELGQAKSFEELHNVLVLMGNMVFKNYGDTCKVPKVSDFKALCADVGTKAKAPIAEIMFYEDNYEKRLLQLACVNLKIDSEEIILRKVKAWWEKYKTGCKCDSLGFNIQNGNLLKFALSQNSPDVIENLASFYELDINFVDPADRLNLLDYINSEIAQMKKLTNSGGSIAVWEDYKKRIIGLGGKSNKK